MMTDEQQTMISEETFDPHMRRTMERLEEKLHRGDRTVEVDIHEMLHLIGRIVGLQIDLNRTMQILNSSFQGYRQIVNSMPPRPLPQAPEPTK